MIRKKKEDKNNKVKNEEREELVGRMKLKERKTARRGGKKKKERKLGRGKGYNMVDKNWQQARTAIILIFVPAERGRVVEREKTGG